MGYLLVKNVGLLLFLGGRRGDGATRSGFASSASGRASGRSSLGRGGLGTRRSGDSLGGRRGGNLLLLGRRGESLLSTIGITNSLSGVTLDFLELGNGGGRRGLLSLLGLLLGLLLLLGALAGLGGTLNLRHFRRTNRTGVSSALTTNLNHILIGTRGVEGHRQVLGKLVHSCGLALASTSDNGGNLRTKLRNGILDGVLEVSGLARSALANVVLLGLVVHALESLDNIGIINIGRVDNGLTGEALVDERILVVAERREKIGLSGNLGVELKDITVGNGLLHRGVRRRDGLGVGQTSVRAFLSAQNVHSKLRLGLVIGVLVAETITESDLRRGLLLAAAMTRHIVFIDRVECGSVACETGVYRQGVDLLRRGFA